jgi:hypothetical protein
MRGLAKIGLRLMLIYIFITTLTSGINYSVSAWSSYAEVSGVRYYSFSWYPLVYIFGYIIALGLIVWVFLKSEAIINWLAGNTEDTQIVLSTSNEDLFNFLLRFLGIILVIQNAAWLLGFLGYWAAFIAPNHGKLDVASSEITSLFTHGLTVVAGVVLIMGTSRIAGWFRGLWERGGMSETEDGEE